MSSIDLYNSTALACSKAATQRYSTSFSLGIKLLGSPVREAIYSVYGFVRFADEIVDTFHDHDKASLLERFRQDTFRAMDEGISTNPILQSFQITANRYCIDKELIGSFFDSMAMDLNFKEYDRKSYQSYIYGSAEVVGLMCLRVFYRDEHQKYETLKFSARKLGEAFQKVNFLRDVQADIDERGRTYFPHVDLKNFSLVQKEQIEKEIEKDFQDAYDGIVQLKREARLGVYIAYIYYQKLFRKIKKKSPTDIMQQRIRISNWTKIALLFRGLIRHEFGRV